MIVIHIFGGSNSGKTHMTEALCRRLSAFGKVETIKHLGHHTFLLEENKDTTIHFLAGAAGSTGIDTEKSVTILRNGDLYSTLDTASDRGAVFCIVEGFKQTPIPGIALGDVEGATALLRNPTIEDIMGSFDIFPTWTTPKAVLDSLLHKRDPRTANDHNPEIIHTEAGSVILLYGFEQDILERAAATARNCPGITGAEGTQLITGCTIPEMHQKGCLAVTGISGVAVASAISCAIKTLTG
ncbi:MAG: molybdopterin-guanine dinucleotide biosynthesis protein B [Methanocalculus sp. MSAO_Arc2]|uniref:molybdopterin-guanine dinucleotide biosynthesis protein B n=1 Tax=Methanocalculus sp. MSAO_Arc2 TaxID=2293855 RepID=UPI000FF24E02|nr:MAG: molybdopterin-guanine dinucleotide biosynthesis protein B [Methanocalculus sp. MSAO_Arc2]